MPYPPPVLLYMPSAYVQQLPPGYPTPYPYEQFGYPHPWQQEMYVLPPGYFDRPRPGMPTAPLLAGTMSPTLVLGPQHMPRAVSLPLVPHRLLFEQNAPQPYPLVRGVLLGGSLTRAPEVPPGRNIRYTPVELDVESAAPLHVCFPPWSSFELHDMRRIVRVKRWQSGPRIEVEFEVLGAAVDHPEPEDGSHTPGVVEVSCIGFSLTSGAPPDRFYITLVEVLKIVELLTQPRFQNIVEKRRERGRVRLNLVPFWLRKPISSKLVDDGADAGLQEFRAVLARRIMGYEVRKPRGFDKEVRILEWVKLGPALQRALQSYYVEMPCDR